MDVVFITMPFAHIGWPSISLGVLKSLLAKGGIECKVIYGNLLFAEIIDMEMYYTLESSWKSNHLCDWLFQKIVFPERYIPVEECFYTHVLNKKIMNILESLHALQALQQKSNDFIQTLAQDILKENPRLIGCTVTSIQLFPTLALLKTIKQMSPLTSIVIGGPGCEGIMGKTLHECFSCIDYVISGDSDTVIVDFVQSILHGQEERLITACRKQNILTPDHRKTKYSVHRETVRQKVKQTITSLEHVPPPDYDDYFSSLQNCTTLGRHIKPSLLFETSRGCAWGEKNACKFCGECGTEKTYRKKKPEQLITEFQYLLQRYQINSFVAVDNHFDPDYFKSFISMLSDLKEDLTLVFDMRAITCREKIRIFKKANIKCIQFGIESLNSKSLKSMNKGKMAWENIQCLKWCRQYGIAVPWFILTRFPGEEDAWNQEQAELVPYITHLQPPLYVSIIRPDRYSHYFIHAKKYNLQIKPKADYVKLFSIPQEKAQDITSLFENVTLEEDLLDPFDDLVNQGYKNIKHSVTMWKKIFWGFKEKPVLGFIPEKNKRIIKDTRPASKHKIHTLNSLCYEILDYCQNAPASRDVHEHFLQQGILLSDIESSIQTLQTRMLVLNIDNKILSLVLDLPYEDYQYDIQSPLEGFKQTKTKKENITNEQT